MGILDVIKNHPILTGTISGVTIGTGAGYVMGRVTSSRKKTNRKKRTYKIKRNRRKSLKTHRRTLKRRTHKNKIHYTKNGQPYIIKANGRALFISKKSNKLRKHRKGGYY